jgi:putative DNA primase/helicase
MVPLMPVPADAPLPPTAHPKLGEPSATWCYRDATGQVLGYVLRFDGTDGKQFRPLTCWRPAAGGEAAWRWESWPPRRPLYGLDRLAQRPSAPVVVTEGEKAADAATDLLTAFVAATSANGSKSAGKVDWSPLRGRRVVIWPDADAAGLEYAHSVAKLATAAGAMSVAIMSPPPGCAPGWDARDALAEKWTPARAAELVAAAVPFDKTATKKATPAERCEQSAADDGEAGSRHRTPQRDMLIACTEFAELWHDADRNAYASFSVNNHVEHWPVRSRDFKMWMSGQFYEKTGGGIGGQALEDGIRILEARGVNEGRQHDCFTRIGHADGKMYLDLGDPHWRAIEISATAWRPIEKPPLKFLRSSSMRPLPDPEPGSLIEELREFINVNTDADFMLVVAWIVNALRPRGPYPILAISGEAGTGKSLVSRMIRSLVDPGAAPIRGVPKDERDLIAYASNSHVLAFDNLSNVAPWLADALCRLATGSGFGTRSLHTNRDEMIFEGAKPLILNGISSLTNQADLADRTVTINLRVIAEEDRRPEDEMLAEFERARPHILGALLDAVSCAHGNVGKVRLDRAPRMADFVKWITAAEPGLGWEPGAFLVAYSENRSDVAESTFEADSVAMAIYKLVTTTHVDGFEGTATDLLALINSLTSEGIRKSKYWPQTAAQLGNRVKRAAPLLRTKGCAVDRGKSGPRFIIVTPPQLRI